MLLALIFAVALYLILPDKRPLPVFGLAVAFFALTTIVQEFARATIVRARWLGESVPVAFWRLVNRNRRRYGGYVVHLGVVLIAFGIVASNAYKVEVTRRAAPGEEIRIGAYSLTYQGLGWDIEGEKDVIYASLSVEKNGRYLGEVRAEKVFYANWKQHSTEVGILSNFQEDLYVILSTWEKGGVATFKVLVNPLVAWIWAGGYLLVAGTVFALWPGKGSDPGPKYTRGV
ncbi:MAG: cytochrome c-type biosis protein CcmF [Clostridia bacterium]|nr:cytochrome c-type biosis protein CcmF [Clostridia bacterium]